MKTLKIKFLAILCLIAGLSTSCRDPWLLGIDPSKHNGGGSAMNYDLPNWMASVDGTKKLSELSIPGTHNSGARYESYAGTAMCQTLTIDAQLNAGVRYLDIRGRHLNNTFEIYHGSVYQKMNFTDVLNLSANFLINHPTETIIMSIKEEHTSVGNTRSYEATFDSYVQQNPSLWQLGESVPMIDNMRGKIQLLRRFNASNLPKGINATNWADNTTFEINTATANLKIQDQYKVPNNDGKWNVFTALTSEAKTGSANRLYINYSSGYKSGLFGIPNTSTVSNDINPRLTNFFTANTSGRVGIIAMDFAEAGRNDLIVKTNF